MQSNRRRAPDLAVQRLLVLHWGHDWPRGSWTLGCPACGNADRIRSRFGRLVCFGCGAQFTATASALPLPTIPIPIWVIATYLLTSGASTRQLAVLGIGHKSALTVASTVRRRIGLPGQRTRLLRPSALALALTRAGSDRLLLSTHLRKQTAFVFWDIREPK